MISFEAVPEDGYTATLLYNGKALDVSTEEEFISFWEEIVATGELTISATATKIEEGTE